MGRRIDYYDDPGAPAANSLVPSANVVVTNDASGRMYLRSGQSCDRSLFSFALGSLNWSA